MAETVTLTLTDFLLARIAEDEEREVEASRSAFVEGLPSEVLPRASAAHDRLMLTQATHLSFAFRRLGWAMALTPPLAWLGFGYTARQRAGDYADHPDYREEWKP